MHLRPDYNKILDLRLSGKTYGEIRKVFKVPKSTLSSWLKNIKLSEKSNSVLKKKHKAGLVALGEFNKRRTLANQQENETIRKEYETKVNKLTERELMLIGAALYWAEGYKNFGKPAYIQVSFVNSDSLMILVFLKFMERFLKITRNQLKPVIMLHINITRDGPLKFWSTLLRIPKENFHFTQFTSPASKQIRPRNLLPNGTLQLRIHKRQEFFKIRGLIDGIIKNI